MEAEIIRSLAKDFESNAYIHDGIECWNARDLQRLLGYARRNDRSCWENFENATKKAKQSCANAGFSIENQFCDFTKMVEIGSDLL